MAVTEQIWTPHQQLWTPETLSNPFELEPASVVAFEYAHPDDEAMNALALAHVVRARNEGRIERVVINYLTDGEASSNPGHLPQNDRIDEVLGVLHDVFGIDEDDVTFSRLADGQLSSSDTELAVLEHAEKHGATHVVTTGPGSKNPSFPNHEDHNAVHDAALETRNHDTKVWGLDSDGLQGVKVVGRRSLKLDILEGHGSQFTVISRADWPEEWGGNLPGGWHLVEGRALDSYTYGVLLNLGIIMLKERFVKYPPSSGDALY